MPPRLPEDTNERILALLPAAPTGLRLEALHGRLGDWISRRSLQRKLAELQGKGLLKQAGEGKATTYYLADRQSATVTPQGASLTMEAGSVFALPLSAAGEEVFTYLSRPVIERPPVGYRREFLEAYRPNETRYLSAEVCEHLHRIGRTSAGERPAGTYARQIVDRLLIDLSWASSRLEGNTYSLLETERLIGEGQAAVGKDQTETQMILNHKAAIEFLIGSADEVGFNRYTILNLHALLSDNLLPNPAACGRLRDIPVGIGRSSYLPLAMPQLIEELFAQVLDTAEAIRDPFEQAFFVMVHLPYLQPFEDVNKRVSRLAANIPLIRQNLCPISFIDVPERAYIDGTLGVYELNRVELLRDVFVWTYERACQRYVVIRQSLGEPDPFRLKYRQELTTAIQAIVRGGQADYQKGLSEWMRDHIPDEDRARFLDRASQELQQLHEGNLARHRLRPSELRVWQAIVHEKV